MLDFFRDVMIITGGIFCLALWIAFFVLLMVELIDTVTGNDRGPLVQDEDDYLNHKGG